MQHSAGITRMKHRFSPAGQINEQINAAINESGTTGLTPEAPHGNPPYFCLIDLMDRT